MRAKRAVLGLQGFPLNQEHVRGRPIGLELAAGTTVADVRNPRPCPTRRPAVHQGQGTFSDISQTVHRSA